MNVRTCQFEIHLHHLYSEPMTAVRLKHAHLVALYVKRLLYMTLQAHNWIMCLYFENEICKLDPFVKSFHIFPSLKFKKAYKSSLLN